MTPSSSYKATPLSDLCLPSDVEVASNSSSPVAKTAVQSALDKRWPTPSSNDTATRDTGFKRGIPGCDNC